MVGRVSRQLQHMSRITDAMERGGEMDAIVDPVVAPLAGRQMASRAASGSRAVPVGMKAEPRSKTTPKPRRQPLQHKRPTRLLRRHNRSLFSFLGLSPKSAVHPEQPRMETKVHE